MTAALSLLVMLGVLGPFASGAMASHFRAGNLSWQKSGAASGGNQTVTFQNQQSWRWSAFGKPAVGAIVSNGEGCIDFGDGTSACPQYLVTFVNAAEDYVIMHALAPGSTTDRNVPHTYSSSGPFTATTSSCCTISALNNANDASWRVQALVDLASDDESARSTVPPIVQLPAGGEQNYTVPAIDSGGETKRFRLATNQESCGGCPSGQPPGLTIDPSTGKVTWDTTGRDSGSGLWWTGVVVESLVGGNVVSSTQIQYIIRVGGSASNQAPAWDDAVTPADGTVYTVNPGDTVSFTLKAIDPDAGDTVQIAQNAGPGTLTPTDGNPATATFSYTATAADVGTDQTVQFLAQDNGNPPLGPPFRSFTLRVVAAAPADTTAPACALSAQGTDGSGKKYIEVTTRDTGSGLASINVDKSTNANTVVPSFTTGTTDAVVVRATKIDQTKSSVVQLTVTDVAGNKVTCDPVITVVTRGIGKPVTESYAGLPAAEHFVRITNEDPGINDLSIKVNGKTFQAAGLKPGEQRTIDVASAMKPGNDNTIELTARGKPGGSALVVISD